MTDYDREENLDIQEVIQEFRKREISKHGTKMAIGEHNKL